MVSLSALNFLNLFYISRVEDYYKEKISWLVRGDNYYKKYYIQEDEQKVQQLSERYKKLVLLWEVILTVSSILLFYLVLNRTMKREKKYQEFLELVILSVSHKFGNFVSALKINLELIKSSGSKRAISSMDNYISLMQDELKVLTEILRKTKEEDIQEVFLTEIIEEILLKLEPKDKKIIREYKNIRLRGDKNSIENILFILLHNSVKYSKSFIHIRIFKNRVVGIRNDIESRGGGSGIGLTLAKKFCQLYNWRLKVRPSKRYFTVFLVF